MNGETAGQKPQAAAAVVSFVQTWCVTVIRNAKKAVVELRLSTAKRWHVVMKTVGAGRASADWWGGGR